MHLSETNGRNRKAKPMETSELSRTRRRPNAAQPARMTRLFLFLSLSLNLGLLLFLALVTQRPEAVSATQTRGPILRTLEAKHFSARPAHASPWAQLESDDLAVYASNLRASGCPSETVRDILLPLIDEKFGHLEASVSEPTNFWANFSQRRAAASAWVEQGIALRQQKDKAIKEILGFEWSSEGLDQARASEAAGSVGCLDYDSAEKLLCITDRFNAQFLRVASSHRIDRRSAIYQKWHDEISEILSPADLEETELRGMLMIFQRRNPNLCSAGLSGSEMRQLMTFRCELSKAFPSALIAGDNELLQEPDSTGERQFLVKARGLLGDNRFIDYLKSCDASFEKTLAALEQEHAPRTLALQLFDLRQEATARAQEIRDMPVRRAEKRTQLVALRQSALEQFTAFSNAGTDSPLLRINEEWLHQIEIP